MVTFRPFRPTSAMVELGRERPNGMADCYAKNDRRRTYDRQTTGQLIIRSERVLKLKRVIWTRLLPLTGSFIN